MCLIEIDIKFKLSTIKRDTKMRLSRLNKLRALVTSAKKTAAQVEQIEAAQLPTVSKV